MLVLSPVLHIIIITKSSLSDSHILEGQMVSIITGVGLQPKLLGNFLEIYLISLWF